jgi:hypothetical protein
MRSQLFILAISAVLTPAASAVAQQPELHTRQHIEQMVATFTERYNKQDAAGIATMFTKDAVRVSSAAPAVGPQAIEEIFRAQFKAGYNHIDETVDQVSPRGDDGRSREMTRGNNSGTPIWSGLPSLVRLTTRP